MTAVAIAVGLYFGWKVMMAEIRWGKRKRAQMEAYARRIRER